MAQTDTLPAPPGAPRRSAFQALEIDTRLLGMIGAFVVVCVVFNVLTDGRFLTPRNVFNLTIQTVSVAIMATGMVFVIVTRNIDLSVGSLLATCSAVMAMTQTQWLPGLTGLPLDHWAIAPLAIVAGLVTGAGIGAFQGWLVGYLAIPAFIVTLGGLLVWRNVAWYLTNGQTIGPLDPAFLRSAASAARSASRGRGSSRASPPRRPCGRCGRGGGAARPTASPSSPPGRRRRCRPSSPPPSSASPRS